MNTSKAKEGRGLRATCASVALAAWIAGAAQAAPRTARLEMEGSLDARIAATRSAVEWGLSGANKAKTVEAEALERGETRIDPAFANAVCVNPPPTPPVIPPPDNTPPVVPPPDTPPDNPLPPDTPFIDVAPPDTPPPGETHHGSPEPASFLLGLLGTVCAGSAWVCRGGRKRK